MDPPTTWYPTTLLDPLVEGVYFKEREGYQAEGVRGGLQFQGSYRIPLKGFGVPFG